MVIVASRRVADTRLLQGAAGTLTMTARDSDGEPAAGIVGVTVTITRDDGTVIATAQNATSDTLGGWSYNVTAAQTATLDLLHAAWSAGGVVIASTLHEVVGGYYFTIGEARAIDASLAPQSKYADTDVLDKRREVEDEFERICEVAFVPRYRRVTLSGRGDPWAMLPDPLVRSVRAVRTYTQPATTYTDLNSDQLAMIVVDPSGKIHRTDGGYFLWGEENIVVTYEHGYDRAPWPIKRAAITRLRERLNSSRSGIPERATSYTVEAGGSYGLATAGAFSTGNPDIDAVLADYSCRHP